MSDNTDDDRSCRNSFVDSEAEEVGSDASDLQSEKLQSQEGEDDDEDDRLPGEDSDSEQDHDQEDEHTQIQLPPEPNEKDHIVMGNWFFVRYVCTNPMEGCCMVEVNKYENEKMQSTLAALIHHSDQWSDVGCDDVWSREHWEKYGSLMEQVHGEERETMDYRCLVGVKKVGSQLGGQSSTKKSSIKCLVTDPYHRIIPPYPFVRYLVYLVDDSSRRKMIGRSGGLWAYQVLPNTLLQCVPLICDRLAGKKECIKPLVMPSYEDVKLFLNNKCRLGWQPNLYKKESLWYTNTIKDGIFDEHLASRNIALNEPVRNLKRDLLDPIASQNTEQSASIISNLLEPLGRRSLFYDLWPLMVRCDGDPRPFFLLCGVQSLCANDPHLEKRYYKFLWFLLHNEPLSFLEPEFMLHMCNTREPTLNARYLCRLARWKSPELTKLAFLLDNGRRTLLPHERDFCWASDQLIARDGRAVCFPVSDHLSFKVGSSALMRSLYMLTDDQFKEPLSTDAQECFWSETLFTSNANWSALGRLRSVLHPTKGALFHSKRKHRPKMHLMSVCNGMSYIDKLCVRSRQIKRKHNEREGEGGNNYWELERDKRRYCTLVVTNSCENRQRFLYNGYHHCHLLKRVVEEDPNTLLNMFSALEYLIIDRLDTWTIMEFSHLLHCLVGWQNEQLKFKDEKGVLPSLHKIVITGCVLGRDVGEGSPMKMMWNCWLGGNGSSPRKEVVLETDTETEAKVKKGFQKQHRSMNERRVALNNARQQLLKFSTSDTKKAHVHMLRNIKKSLQDSEMFHQHESEPVCNLLTTKLGKLFSEEELKHLGFLNRVACQYVRYLRYCRTIASCQLFHSGPNLVLQCLCKYHRRTPTCPEEDTEFPEEIADLLNCRNEDKRKERLQRYLTVFARGDLVTVDWPKCLHPGDGIRGYSKWANIFGELYTVVNGTLCDPHKVFHHSIDPMTKDHIMRDRLYSQQRYLTSNDRFYNMPQCLLQLRHERKLSLKADNVPQRRDNQEDVLAFRADLPLVDASSIDLHGPLIRSVSTVGGAVLVVNSKTTLQDLAHVLCTSDQEMMVVIPPGLDLIKILEINSHVHVDEDEDQDQDREEEKGDVDPFVDNESERISMQAEKCFGS